jgi:hypothetical protein
MSQPGTSADGSTESGPGRAQSEWSFYPVLERFPDFGAAWDELNERLYHGHPLLDSCFVGSCVRHFATAMDVLAVHGPPQRPNGMVLLRRARPGVSRTFLPSQAQIAPVLLDSSATAGSLLHGLPGYNLWLDFLCQDSEYSCFSSERLKHVHDRLAHAITTRVRLHGEFDAYWTRRSRNLRKNVRRYQQWLVEDGYSLRLELVTDPRKLAEALHRYGDLESRGWKGIAGSAIHWRNTQGRFYHDVLQCFARKGQAAIYELYCNDVLAAALVTIASNRMLVLLKTTYDMSLAKYSPGWLMIYELLKKEFQERRFEAVEFYTYATPLLLGWATDVRAIEHVTVYRAPWCKQVAALGRRGRKVISRLRDQTRALGSDRAKPMLLITIEETSLRSSAGGAHNEDAELDGGQ